MATWVALHKGIPNGSTLETIEEIEQLLITPSPKILHPINLHSFGLSQTVRVNRSSQTQHKKLIKNNDDSIKDTQYYIKTTYIME